MEKKEGKNIIYEVDRGKKIAWITLNRPEKLNALSTEGWDEVKQQALEAEEDEDVKVVVIKGAGECFSTGHDVDDLGPHHGWSDDPKARRPSIRRRLTWDNHVFWGKRGMCQTILNLDKATIAQIRGYCYGGGLELAVACDIAIAAEDAWFTHPGYRYIGPLGEITLLYHLMGPRKVKEMMLTGTPVTAKEALECGLVNRVVPIEKLEEEVNKMAETIALQPFDAIVMGKAFFEAANDAVGISIGYTMGYIGHTLQTNIRYEPDEFNLFRERGKKGRNEAFRKRERRFEKSPLAVHPSRKK